MLLEHWRGCGSDVAGWDHRSQSHRSHFDHLEAVPTGGGVRYCPIGRLKVLGRE